MIAQRILIDDEPRRPRTRAARGAAERRRARTKRLRYVVSARIACVVGVLTLAVVSYLALMGNIERMNYELGHAEAERAKLLAQSVELDDTLARLRSRERLARIAAQLGMRDSASFAEIVVPADRHPQAPATGLALLARLR
jgi:sensor histidine kinase regulating citrate/malate metabolism